MGRSYCFRIFPLWQSNQKRSSSSSSSTLFALKKSSSKSKEHSPKESVKGSIACSSSSTVPVKVTSRVVRALDFEDNRMINEYVKVGKIGNGSYGKVVLHRSTKDNRLYAIKVFQRSRLCKLRVTPSENALTDVHREIEIMKRLRHPNIVNLFEVIDDPNIDRFYIVLEYVEGREIFEGSGPPGGIGEELARRYFKDIADGLMYLHGCNIVHGDIKPENLLIGGDGRVRIGDFSVSKSFEGSNDVLLRSPGTPAFSAPECCSGSAYHGKPADVWALGVTLYCMVLGCYPFLGSTLQDTYDKIMQEPLQIPEHLNPDLVNLLRGLLCKDADPEKRMTLDKVVQHPWVTKMKDPSQ